MKKNGWNQKYNVKMELIRFVRRLDEVGKENRVIKDYLILGLSNWIDDR